MTLELTDDYLSGGLATPYSQLPEDQRPTLSAPLPELNWPTGVGKIIAHRGGGGVHPENTAMAFDAAYAAGLRVLETDIQVTADGVGFCFHDDTMKRMTGLPGSPADYTWDQLKDVAVTTTRKGVEGEGRLLLIEDFLANYTDAELIVDVKTPDDARVLADAINRTGAAARTCVTHSYDEVLESVREMTSPDLQRGLGWSTFAELVACARAGVTPPPAIKVANYAHLGWDVAVAALPTHDGRSALDGRPAREASVEHLASDPEFLANFVAMSHELGMAVRVWTINDPQRMRLLWDAGVDAIFTDYPQVALAELGA